jgi:hypothetical protein
MAEKSRFTENVSVTAFWVAALRARETERSAGLFRRAYCGAPRPPCSRE